LQDYAKLAAAMAILWGWKIDGFVPDKFDIIGGIIALLGMAIIMYAPRR